MSPQRRFALAALALAVLAAVFAWQYRSAPDPWGLNPPDQEDRPAGNPPGAMTRCSVK